MSSANIHQHYVGRDVDPLTGQKLSKKELDQRPFYYFIRDGDFDLVWPNISVFVIGHLLFFYSYYIMYTQHPWNTWFWSEYTIRHDS